MGSYSPEDFADKTDSIYRLVVLASRRANQVAKPETRALVPTTSSSKPTLVALDEIYNGKVTYRESAGDDEDYLE